MAMCDEAGKPEMDEWTWVTREGREIKVADMDDIHLLNTVRMLQRRDVTLEDIPPYKRMLREIRIRGLSL
jgi:hypothetical protein